MSEASKIPRPEYPSPQSYTPEDIRKLAIEELTSRDTTKLSERLVETEAGSKILSSFREYFRVGVDRALKGKIKAL